MTIIRDLKRLSVVTGVAVSGAGLLFGGCDEGGRTDHGGFGGFGGFVGLDAGVPAGSYSSADPVQSPCPTVRLWARATVQGSRVTVFVFDGLDGAPTELASSQVSAVQGAQLVRKTWLPTERLLELVFELGAADAGSGDGGSQDGGAPDGGAADGGAADGGAADGGAADGGAADGGAADGGAVDGGAADGGEADGGAADGGAADGGAADGGAADGGTSSPLLDGGSPDASLADGGDSDAGSPNYAVASFVLSWSSVGYGSQCPGRRTFSFSVAPSGVTIASRADELPLGDRVAVKIAVLSRTAQQVRLRAFASAGERAVASWSVSNGALQRADDTSVVWNLPTAPGHYLAEVAVDDGEAGLAFDSVIFEVT